jgi:hypothetical protein
MDHEDKESKKYVVKVKKYDPGKPEEFLKWCLILNEQLKNNGYSSYDMVMNLVQAMLVGRSLEAFLSERRSQEAKKRIRKAKDHTMHTLNQIYDCAIFELAIRAFEIQSGWRDAYEREREYMIRDLFMGKLNPEKFSQRLQDLNKYLHSNWENNTGRQDKEGIWKVISRRWNQVNYGTINPNWMDSEFFSTCKRTLEIQGFGRPAEHVKSAVASRSAEADHCKYGWKDFRQNKWRGKKIVKEIITIQVVAAVAVARPIMAEEDAEEEEDALFTLLLLSKSW